SHAAGRLMNARRGGPRGWPGTPLPPAPAGGRGGAVSDTPPPDFPPRGWPPPRFPTPLQRFPGPGLLGEGGMGTVYKAFHLSLKRYVAIKVLRLDGARHPDLVSRFLREMESVGQMDHPNVVRATDAGQSNGVFYLVMEFLTGSDLARLV